MEGEGDKSELLMGKIRSQMRFSGLWWENQRACLKVDMRLFSIFIILYIEPNLGIIGVKYDKEKTPPQIECIIPFE
jgi:hypothetical protein